MKKKDKDEDEEILEEDIKIDFKKRKDEPEDLISEDLEEKLEEIDLESFSAFMSHSGSSPSLNQVAVDPGTPVRNQGVPFEEERMQAINYESFSGPKDEQKYFMSDSGSSVDAPSSFAVERTRMFQERDLRADFSIGQQFSAKPFIDASGGSDTNVRYEIAQNVDIVNAGRDNKLDRIGVKYDPNVKAT